VYLPACPNAKNRGVKEGGAETVRGSMLLLLLMMMMMMTTTTTTTTTTLQLRPSRT